MAEKLYCVSFSELDGYIFCVKANNELEAVLKAFNKFAKNWNLTKLMMAKGYIENEKELSVEIIKYFMFEEFGYVLAVDECNPI